MDVTHCFSEQFSEAVEAWKEAIKLQPDSPDAHTSAYFVVLSKHAF